MGLTQRKSSSVLIGSSLISYSSILFGAICVGLFVMVAANQVGAMQMVDQSDPLRSTSATVALVENPELTVRVLENLLRSILYSAAPAELQPLTNGAQKRGIDLGISRGFSGSQAGKHLMGLSAASFANGPGRR